MSKRLLVLAASVHQLPFINCAIRLGHEIITADNRPDNPGHRLAHTSLIVDTTDWESVLAEALTRKVDGVLAACTDVAVETAARVAEAIGSNGPSVEAARILCRKKEFRQFLTRYPDFNPDFAIDEEVEKRDFSRGLWVAKPDRSSGAKGVFVFRTRAEFDAGIGVTKEHSINSEFLVEEFVDGSQHTIEGWLSDGKISVDFVLDRQTPPAVEDVRTIGHRFPSILAETTVAELRRVLENIFQDLVYRNGPFDCDFVVLPSGQIALLEIAPRAGGNSIAWLLQEACGFDMVGACVASVLGMPPTVTYQLPTEAYSLRIIQGPLDWPRALVSERFQGFLAQSWIKSCFVHPTPEGSNQTGFGPLGCVLIVGRNGEETVERESLFDSLLPAEWQVC